MAEEANTRESASAIPRISMGQRAQAGVVVYGGRIYEEMNEQLRWPQAIFTYKKMLQDATVAPAISLVETAIAEVPWVIKTKNGFEEEHAEKKAFLESVMHDLDMPFSTFVRQAATHHSFGFALTEKVYRRCTASSGSRYDDGLIRLRRLAPIPQDTVQTWTFGDDGKSLRSVQQQIVPVSNRDGKQVSKLEDYVNIDRKKFMLFRNSHAKDNPEGRSPLNDCYIAWKYKTKLEENEAIGVATDLRGMKTLFLPPDYLSDDATPEQKSVREYYERAMSLLHKGEQTALILPQMFDDKGNKLFDFKLESVMGTQAHNVREIINGYRKEIVTALHAAQLILGQEGGGSYSLAESQSTVSRMVIEARLREIRDQLNYDLIPQLFRLNGWDVRDTPYFDFGEVTKESLDEIGKFIQRTAAVGLMPKTADTVNWITDRLGLEPQFNGDETTEEIAPYLTGYTSGSGEGLVEGLGSGTGTAVSQDDNSISNVEN